MLRPGERVMSALCSKSPGASRSGPGGAAARHVEGQRPTATDLVGAAIAIGGALVIIGLASRPQ